MCANALFGMTRRRLALAGPRRRPGAARRLDDLAVEQRVTDLDRALVGIWSVVGRCDREGAFLAARRRRAGAGSLGDGQVRRRAAENRAVHFVWRELGFGEADVVAGIR